MTAHKAFSSVAKSRERFLSAADQVFLRCGYDGATIRQIAAEAGMSLASLSRYWASKENLFGEVFARHFDRIHQAQNSRLDAVELQAGPDGPTVRAILQAFYDPALHASTGPREQRLSHMVYCRALVDPASPARRIVAKLIKQISKRVIGLLRRALPALDAEHFYLFVAIAMGAYIQPQLFGMQMARVMGVRYSRIDWSRASDILAHLVEAGMRGVLASSSQASRASSNSGN
jgi:AcrR family transcriptional regulator